MQYRFLDSPIGQLMIAGEDGCLRRLSFAADRKFSDLVRPEWVRRDDLLEDVAAQLDEYFKGTRRHFEVPIHSSVLVDTFSSRVWRALREIPFGETRSYREIAEFIDRPKAYRAVGQANHRNPIAIIIPCHRVIGSDGTLTGFGGGLGTKKFLLDLEAHVLQGTSDRAISEELAA